MLIENLFCIPITQGRAGKMTREKVAMLENELCFRNVFARNVLDALDAIDVENVPATMDKRVILQSILWYGSVVFFEKAGGIFSLPGAPVGDGFNMYGHPGKAWVWTRNGQMNEQVTLNIPGGDENSQLEIMTSMQKAGKGNGVFIWDNALRFPFINIVIDFSEKIADSYRMLDVMRRNLKAPYIIAAGESVNATVKQYLDQRDKNVDAMQILNTGAFDPKKDIAVFPLDLNSQSLKDVVELIEWYENKLRELNGISSNSQIDKKGENIITDEVHINDMYENMQIDKRLEYLNGSVELWNKLYGTNIKFVKKHNENVEQTEDMSDDQNNDVRGTEE